MLLMVIGVALSSCATASSGTSPTNNGVTVIDDDNARLFAPTHSNVVLVKAYEPSQLADLSGVLYFGFVPAPKTANVKLGALKNKVNLFHLFYRNKI